MKFVDALRSPAFAHAYAVAAFASVFLRFFIEHMAGLWTYIAIVASLCVIAVAVLIARRRELAATRLTSIWVIAFVAWALMSQFWTEDGAQTLWAWISTAAIALIGITVVNIRDTTQIVRAVADVMRVLLSLSLLVELISGVFLDMPLSFLHVNGALAQLGPIQGIFGSRSALGFVSVIALISFVVEWRAMLIPSRISLFSVALGGVTAVLTGSPIVLLIGIATIVATGVLLLVRHTPASQRAVVQIGLAAMVLIALVVTYLTRHQLLDILGAQTAIDQRYQLWVTVLSSVQYAPIFGWGWFGPWPDLIPFTTINFVLDQGNSSALNAFFDVLLQLGWVGFVLFVALGAVAFVRSWVAASDRTAVIYAWTPLILVALVVDGLLESTVLTGFGWLMLVVCATRASHHHLRWEWRGRLPDRPHSAEIS